MPFASFGYLVLFRSHPSCSILYRLLWPCAVSPEPHPPSGHHKSEGTLRLTLSFSPSPSGLYLTPFAKFSMLSILLLRRRHNSLLGAPMAVFMCNRSQAFSRSLSKITERSLVAGVTRVKS
ncbi:hypothetical protein B0H12DRAFT_57991 [Mycena haematopus]|nr:hypothetical protein B0H12DRAFT_57991 [Mycena haematopus]